MRLLQFTNQSKVQVGVLVSPEDTTARLLPRGRSVVDLIKQARESQVSLEDVMNEAMRSPVGEARVDLSESVVELSDGPAGLGLPVSAPEVWGAGLTYKSSRRARELEADPQNASVYTRAYSAERPEMFLKDADCRRTVPSGASIGVRGDSKWTVPEPEIALILDADGRICAFTAGNDVTARDIEAANPLYLPQAKTFGGSCSIGPVALVANGEVPEFEIRITIRNSEDATVFEGETSLSEMKRPFTELVSFLCRYNSIEDGTVLLTGTGIVPPDSFALAPGHQIDIELSDVGVLRNAVAMLQDKNEGR